MLRRGQGDEVHLEPDGHLTEHREEVHHHLQPERQDHRGNPGDGRARPAPPLQREAGPLSSPAQV